MTVLAMEPIVVDGEKREVVRRSEEGCYQSEFEP